MHDPNARQQHCIATSIRSALTLSATKGALRHPPISSRVLASENQHHLAAVRTLALTRHGSDPGCLSIVAVVNER